MSMILAISTKATSAITNSSGCIATLPAVPGATGQILSLKILNGSSLVAINDKITVAGCLIGSFDLPLTELLAQSTVIDLTFENHALQASGQDIDLTVTVPALTGGAATTVLLYGNYF